MHEWKKGQITIYEWCRVHKIEKKSIIDGEQLPTFAVHPVRNKSVDQSWYSLTHKPTGFNFLYFPNIDNAKRVAEFMETNYVEDFADLVFTRKKGGEPSYDTKRVQAKVLADETFMRLISENAVPFDELVKLKIVIKNNKFKW
jgi:hypothetical protein